MSTRAERRAALAQELNDEAPDVTPDDTLPDPLPVPLAPVGDSTPGAPISLTADQLQSIITTAVTAAVGAMGAGNGNIGGQIADALRANRTPIPEIPFSEFPNKSFYHPAGNAEPRPTLRAPYYLGVWDQASGKAIPVFPIDDKLMTDDEIHAHNQLRPTTGRLQRTDGTAIAARVVEVENASGELHRVVIALPLSAYDRDHRNSLPGLLDIATQLQTPVQ